MSASLESYYPPLIPFRGRSYGIASNLSPYLSNAISKATSTACSAFQEGHLKLVSYLSECSSYEIYINRPRLEGDTQPVLGGTLEVKTEEASVLLRTQNGTARDGIKVCACPHV